MKKRAVLLGDGLMNWAGGIDFFTTIAKALLSQDEQITLLIPSKKFLSKWQRAPLLKHLFGWWVIRKDERLKPFKGAKIVFCRFGKKRLNRALRSLRADVALFCWGDINVDVCADFGYYPDLQHKYLPDFFSTEEKNNRDRSVSAILNKRRVVFVNSLSVKQDLEKFYPKTKCKIIAIPFAPTLADNSWAFPSKMNLTKKYKLHSPYFMISNQFWAHKGHKYAFEALKNLPKEIHLVCTGAKDDFRCPNFFNELLEVIEKLELRSRVHMLGLIPKRDQIELMKGAIAILQPTLFEGGPGGGSVQTAIALGLPVIVSDIPVNLEIPDDKVHFFRSEDSNDLREKMTFLLSVSREEISPKRLLMQNDKNLETLGDALIKAIEAYA